MRDLTYQYGKVRVVTGPLYLPHEEADGKRYVRYQVIGSSDVAVPSHFFKVVTVGEGVRTKQWAYLLPNESLDEKCPLSAFQTTLEKIEKVSGVIFPTKQMTSNNTRN